MDEGSDEVSGCVDGVKADDRLGDAAPAQAGKGLGEGERVNMKRETTADAKHMSYTKEADILSTRR